MGVSEVGFKHVLRVFIPTRTLVRSLGPFLLKGSTLRGQSRSKPNQMAIYDHGPLRGVSEVSFKLVPRDLIPIWTPARALGPFLLQGPTLMGQSCSKPNQMAIYDHGPLMGVSEV